MLRSQIAISPPPFLHLPSSYVNTSTSWVPCSSIHTSVPSRSLAHPALIYCPLLPLSPIFPSFLLTTPCFFSPQLPPLPLHPSDWVMAIRAGSHPAAVWDRHWSHTQSLWAEGTAIHFVHGLIRLTAHCTFWAEAIIGAQMVQMRRLTLTGVKERILCF